MDGLPLARRAPARYIELGPDELPAAQEGYGGSGRQPSRVASIFSGLTDEQSPVFTAMHWGVADYRVVAR